MERVYGFTIKIKDSLVRMKPGDNPDVELDDRLQSRIECCDRIVGIRTVRAVQSPRGAIDCDVARNASQISMRVDRNLSIRFVL